MSEEVTSQIQPIDWTWANERLTLPIYNAVSLSLGYEINALAPVDQAWVGRPFVQPPEDYKQRVATTYEAVRMGMLACHTTTKNGATFDLAAKFSDAQFWEVSTVEFRRFCDERGWRTPADFLPNGYARTVLATGQDNATPAFSVNSASDAPACDFSMLATRSQLIDAFGRFTGMDATWFNNLRDTPALRAARKVVGQGGRGHIEEPWFCPFEVMQWLADRKRRKGRKLSTEKAWKLLEKNFPEVYNARSVADPRAGD